MHWTESGTCTIPLRFMEGIGYLIPITRRDVACRAGQEGMAQEGTGQTESSGHLSLAGFVVDCWCLVLGGGGCYSAKDEEVISKAS